MAVPFTKLQGERVCLRPFRIEDAADIAESCQDPDISRFTTMPDAMTEAEARDWIEQRLELWAGGLHAFAVTLLPSDRCIGQMGIHLEADYRRAGAFYWLDQAAQGQGIATEALNLITEWAFTEFDLARMHLVTHIDNPASQQVAERCGYQQEGVLRAWEPVKDDQPDMMMWSRLPTV